MQISAPGNVPLATLAEYIIQRTYHEIAVLSELLPRKTDLERKMECVHFAHRTRQLFVRLLALVKWAKNGYKIDKCMAISNFLDQQALLFVDTADQLAKIARETLVHARLPAFSIPCAVDVLTTGTYPRLPTCIRERIIPPDPINPQEKTQTLKRLNQIIEYRLATTDIPRSFQKLKISNGRVRLRVDYEFEVTLTLMGDGATVPWRLLDIDILVEDSDSADCNALVHSLQVQYIHQLLQSRLIDSESPVQDIYNCLHSFCQSLQLEVLHSQAQKLILEQLNDAIAVELYVPGKHLHIAYWRQKKAGSAATAAVPPTAYKLDIHVSTSDPSKPLQVQHLPKMPANAGRLWGAAHCIHNSQLSLEKLLLETIHVRSNLKLKQLQDNLEILQSAKNFVLSDVPPTLSFDLLHPCMQSERVRVAVDGQQGLFLTSVMQYSDCPVTKEIQDFLNSEQPFSRAGGETLASFLGRCRIWLAVQRCKKTLQFTQSCVYDKLPFINPVEVAATEKAATQKLYIKLARHSGFYLVVEIKDSSEPLQVMTSYCLLSVIQSTHSGSEEATGISKLYLTAGRPLLLDQPACGNGWCLQAPATRSSDGPSSEAEELLALLRIRQAESSYFLPDLCRIVSRCEERTAFGVLADELWRAGLPNDGVQLIDRGNNGGSAVDEAIYSVSLLELPDLNGEGRALASSMLACTIRANVKIKKWIVECLFSHHPLHHCLASGVGARGSSGRRTLLLYDMRAAVAVSAQQTVREFLADWTAMVKLHNLVETCVESSDWKRVSVWKLDQRRVTFAYGPQASCLVSVYWHGPDMQFQAEFGVVRPLAHRTNLHVVTSSTNPHVVTSAFLLRDLNLRHNLAAFLEVLADTARPLSALLSLRTSPFYAVLHSTRHSQPTTSFTLLPQSATHVRIAYRNIYCIDVRFVRGGLVTIRDGSYSIFDSSKVVEGFTPTQGLKSFLNQFVDNESSSTLPRSSNDDDNPPSPMGMDALESLVARPGGSSGSPRRLLPLEAPSPKTGIAASPAGLANFGLASPLDQPNLMDPSPVPHLLNTSPAPVPIMSPVNMPAPSPGYHMSPGAFVSPVFPGEGSPFPGSVGMPSMGAAASISAPSPKNLPASPAPGAAQRVALCAMGSTASMTVVSQSPQHAALLALSHLQSAAPHSTTSKAQPQRSWAGSVPSVLSDASFEAMLAITAGDGLSVLSTPSYASCCPLERFLGSAFMRRHLQRVLQSEEPKMPVLSHNEPGVSLFRGESLVYKVFLDTGTLQYLRLSPKPIIEYADRWAVEDLQVLERYFEAKVACPPYKANNLLAFCRLLAAPFKVLRDCTQILRMELLPADIFATSARWRVEWCLTLPQGVRIAEPGTAATVVKLNATVKKMLFVLQLTRTALPSAAADGGNVGRPASLALPFLYDMGLDLLQIIEPKHSTLPLSSSGPSLLSTVSEQVKRVQQQQQQQQQATMFQQQLPNNTAILTVVRDLVYNLNI